MPRVSIIMPAYNSASFLPDAINSILDQTFSDFELIIIDDCSTDSTYATIAGYDDSRLHYIQLAKNHGGPSKPRNIGIKEANGEYIALFDSDDIMLPEKLELGVTMLDSCREISAIFTDCYRFLDNGMVYPDTLLQDYYGLKNLLNNYTKDGFFILSAQDAFHNLFLENYIPTSSVMLRKNLLEDIGYFDEALVNGDDRDMWFRLCLNYSIGFINSPLHKYRIRSGSVSSRGIVAHQNRIKVMKKQLNNGLPKTLETLAKKLISRNYFSIGYIHQAQGNMTLAREYYLKSNRYNFRVYSIISYLKTFIKATTIP